MKHANKIKNYIGVTLIEIIISLAIISIIAIGFFTIFSSSFEFIFRSGDRTTAISEAQEIVDAIYISKDTSDTFIQSIDTSETYKKINDCSLMESETFDGTHRVLYCVGTETLVSDPLEKVIVKVFYRNGNESVMLSTIVP